MLRISSIKEKNYSKNAKGDYYEYPRANKKSITITIETDNYNLNNEYDNKLLKLAFMCLTHNLKGESGYSYSRDKSFKGASFENNDLKIELSPKGYESNDREEARAIKLEFEFFMPKRKRVNIKELIATTHELIASIEHNLEQVEDELLCYLYEQKYFEGHTQLPKLVRASQDNIYTRRMVKELHNEFNLKGNYASWLNNFNKVNQEQILIIEECSLYVFQDDIEALLDTISIVERYQATLEEEEKQEMKKPIINPMLAPMPTQLQRF